MTKIQHPKGTTLIELLLYFSMLAVLLLFSMNFALQILASSHISQNLNILQSDKEFISMLLTKSISHSSGIDLENSIFETGADAITLEMTDPTSNPTKFYFENNNIYFKEANNTAIRLNSPETTVTSMTINRLIYPKSPDHLIVDIEFSIADNDITQYQKSLSLHQGISLPSL